MKSFFTAIVLCSTFSLGFPHSRVVGQSQQQPSRFAVVTGMVLDAEDSKALSGTTVIVTDNAGKTISGAISDSKGRFAIPNVPLGNFTLVAKFIGYETLEKPISVTKNDTLRAGMFRLRASAVKTQEVDVTAQAMRVEVKGDTAEFNAKQYKTDKNAAAEDLVRKLPGVEIDASGQVKAQGEQVKRVLVDGKPFFGDDPTAALKNLPAEVIDKVQVFDAMSDQAAFTRFDDGDRTKTLNIVMRQDKKNGFFGKVSAAGGTDERYSLGGNVNSFAGDQRISLIGMSNNINQQNFSIQDILGVMGGGGNPMMQRMGNVMRAFGGGGGMRGGGMRGMFGGGGGNSNPSDFLVGQSEGITTSHAFGLNYTDTWARNLTASGSYFFNYSENNAEQNLNRLYFLQDGNQETLQDNITQTKNINHRVNLRVEYATDSLNSFVLSPRLTVQANNKYNTVSNSTFTAENLNKLNTSDTRSNSNNLGVNFNNSLLYRHRFLTDGRTFSATLTTAFNENSGGGKNNALNTYYLTQSIFADTLRQDLPTEGHSSTLGANLAYTEPLHEGGILQFSYNINQQKNFNDRKTNDFDTLTGDYTSVNSVLSSKAESRYTTQRPGVNYKISIDKEKTLNFGADYQIAELTFDQTFPRAYSGVRTFYNWLPSLSFTARSGMSSNFRLNYRTSTNQPSISQLQPSIDNSDPVRLSTGNPNLRQEFSHNFSANYGTFNMITASAFFAMINVSYTQDKIANSSFVASGDTTLTLDGYRQVRLLNGSQLTQNVNIDGAWNINSFITYTYPIEPFGVKFNLSANAGAMFSRTPSIINDAKNLSDNTTITPSLALVSNISENVDFSVSARTAYSIVRNSIQKQLNSDYYTHTLYARWNFVFWDGFLLTGDFNYIVNGGLSGNLNQSIPLLSAGIGKRFLDGKAEIKLSIFDALNKNQSIARSVQSNYIEDTRTTVLRQYGLLTFTYNFREFGK